MNTTTATYNPSDIYEKWLDWFLKNNPDCWTKSSRQKKRGREFVYRVKNSGKLKRGTPSAVQGKEIAEIMSFTRWQRILELYYLLARKEVIAGKAVRFGHRLGVIRARTISRNFKKKKVNFAETKKQPLIEDPITGRIRREKIIYHTSDTYSAIKWEKSGKVKNERMYKFFPSGGNKARGGFKQEFKTMLRQDPLLSTQYKQCIDELISLD